MQSLHPDDQTLKAYGLGKLVDEQASTVDEHLESCADCRQRISGLTSDSFLGRFREGHQPSARSVTGGSLADGTLSFIQAKVASPPPATDTLPPGLANHPDYEIKRELGRGGMGVVYLAHNTMMGRDEVLKVMGRQIMDRPGVLERFQREIRAVAKLRHSNIVAAYHAFRIEGGLVFSMEYVEGLDLSRLIKAKGPLTVAQATYFVHQAALGLQHAHEKGLIHRDIKPHNLMLTHDGKARLVKVLDFGLAKATREEKVDGGLTSEGQALGTPDYIAPEQIVNALDVDIRADLYSLGGTLFYLLTGRPPFLASSLYDIYQAHMSRDAEPLNLIRPEVPAELAALVAKMMAKEPKRRFQTPAEVALALTPFFKKTVAGIKPLTADVPRSVETPAKRPEPGVATVPSHNVIGMPSTAPARTRDDSPRAEPMWANLIDTSAPGPREEDLAPSSEDEAAPPRPRWPIVAAAGAGLLMLLLGIIIYFRHDEKGTTLAAGTPEDLNKAGITPGTKKEAPPVNVSGDSRSQKSPNQDRDSPTGNASKPKASSNLEDESKSLSEGKGDGQHAPVGLAPIIASPENRKWVSLFNGKDTTGWKTHPSQPGNWNVTNGVLIGSGPTISHLYSERGDYKDFHLRIEARYQEGGSGAVMFRAGLGPELPSDAPKFPKGFHATINSTHPYRGFTGGIYDGSRPEKEWVLDHQGPQIALGEWFTLEILTSGDMLEVFVNGRLRSFYPANNRQNPSGYVVLQQLTPNKAIEFRSIKIREIESKKPSPDEVASLIGHTRRVGSVTFAPDSHRLLTGGLGLWMESWGWGRVNPAGGGDNSVRLWDLSSGRDIQKYPGHFAGVRTAVFSRDGGFAASCGGFWDNQHYDVYDLTVGRRIHEFKLPAASPRLWAATLAFSPDGQRLLVAFPNGTVQPWMLETEKELPLIRLRAGKPDSYEFPAMLFTSDSNHLITGSKSGAVELWGLKTGERLKEFAGHTDALRMLAVSANDGMILSGCKDNTARLWDVASGKQLRLLDCREDGLESLALSPDGQRALTGGRYGTIRLWDLGNGHEIGRLEGHTLRVGCLAFSPDGKRAVSGGDDKTVRIWQISTPAAP